MPVFTGPIAASTQQANGELGNTLSTAHVRTASISPQRSSAPSFAQKLQLESAQRVEARRTPIAPSTARTAIANAYRQLTGETPSESTSAILTAQWAHETGRGASMFNYNFGGIKGVGPSGMTVAQRTREGFGDTERRIVDNFRAYATIDEGAKDYVHLLLSRYGTAMDAARRGDPSGFVRGLKDRGYFTGDPAAYEHSIASITNQLLNGTGAQASHPTANSDLTPLQRSREVRANEASPGIAALPPIQPESSAYWRAAPSPTALLELSTGSRADSAPNGPGLDGLSALRALQMSDEVTRAALRVALDGKAADGAAGNRRR